MRNRTTILLLILATVALSAAAAGVAGYWYIKPTLVTLAVSPEPSPEYRFARKLAEVLTQNRASIRLELKPTESGQQGMAWLAQGEADLALVRSDDRRIPPMARSIAVLEEQVLLFITPAKSKIRSLADLEKRRTVVMDRDGRNEALFRRLMEQYRHDGRAAAVVAVPPGTPLAPLLGPGGGADAAILLLPLSRLAGAEGFATLERGLKGYAVRPVSDASALERKIPGLYAQTIEAGLLSGSPRIPDDDLDTVAVQRLLVARAKLPEQHVVELMRALFENGRQLAVEQTFATRIEPPSTEKVALIAIHPGAQQYVSGEVKTLFDRYADMVFIGLYAAGILGSGAVALYGMVFRRPPVHAGSRAHALAALRERARAACDGQELDAVEAEIEMVLDGVLSGLADGAISPRGLEGFRLAYDAARDAVAAARRALS
ncbi:Putative TRAP-type uncharacterized transport system [Magnetospirillum sp. XM-1]|uniref:TAXI family TRAP transporter solute-binding subunit n=1 Tax=Magnetospirillum sp. XM-1 TaxID=1663591 RepID=UPI00073DD289|nr:TAXI family TRAP transporter solute-binding subunit [Magnetospirillum sp. XM-1]CUW38189.1 Putative TRAP-type uncharacterized transport system [Magnetospirillum sp. XM-1]